MVFQAQGESPTSCAGELGRNPAAPMLQHIVIGLGSRPRLPRRGRHRLPHTTYGRPPDTGGCFLCVKDRSFGHVFQVLIKLDR
eukprot:scaffold23971_cov45-Phaeocystis_antarctica.AAC.1